MPSREREQAQLIREAKKNASHTVHVHEIEVKQCLFKQREVRIATDLCTGVEKGRPLTELRMRSKSGADKVECSGAGWYRTAQG